MTLPALGWLREYDTRWLRGDIVAGITLSAYLLPSAIGDASLAGLAPQAGLYACLFGGLVFWLFCSSRHTAISVTSAISLLIGATLGDIASNDPTRYAALASCTALLVAVLAFLAQVEICCNVVPEQHPTAQRELQQRLQTLLDSRHALHWAPLVIHVFKALPGIEPLIGPANKARLNALLTDTVDATMLSYESIRPAQSKGYHVLAYSGDYISSLSANLCTSDARIKELPEEVYRVTKATLKGQLFWYRNPETVKFLMEALAISDEAAAREINLLGVTVDEAVDRVDKFLDDAFIAQLPQVRIVHGFGTGALRSAITTLLRDHPHVASFEFAPQSQGGRGVTIATMRD